MWGNGGKFYWGRKEDGGEVEGIVVIFAWMSNQEKHLKNYIQLYSSLGWNSLVCHPEYLNLFFPERAATLAHGILNELMKALRIRPCPVVFASFSGGPKACMYKALQIIEAERGSQNNLDEYRLVRECISGQIYDSSPVDFTSDLGKKSVLHPTVLGMSSPPRVLSWIANGVASGLGTLFLNRFESERADYWQTLYASVKMGAPYLILCSEDDDLAPYPIICNFAQRLQDLGGDVKLVKWNSSPHVGHYKQNPTDYKAAVTELLGKAALIFSRKIQKLEEDKMGMEENHNGLSESICNLRKAAVTSNESFKRVAIDPSDHFFLPSSVEGHEDKDVGSFQEERKEGLVHLHSPPKINANGVLGQILFDVCVPKNIEGWDIRASSSLNGLSSRRKSPFNPIKCIRRSRL